MKCSRHILLALFLLHTACIFAQDVKPDTTVAISIQSDSSDLSPGKDTVVLHDPRKATLRSAVIPGWGQAYNREYWKIPLVYTAIGIPAGFFVYNNTWYKRAKSAHDILINKDTASFPKIHPELQGLSVESLRFYRNQFRRDRDYSILYTLVAWGLNVVDATVFAHLKNFDVSDDISFKIKPGYSPLAGTNGISLVLAVK